METIKTDLRDMKVRIVCDCPEDKEAKCVIASVGSKTEEFRQQDGGVRGRRQAPRDDHGGELCRVHDEPARQSRRHVRRAGFWR